MNEHVRLLLFIGAGFGLGQLVQIVAICHSFDPTVATFASMPFAAVLAISASLWLRRRRDRREISRDL